MAAPSFVINHYFLQLYANCCSKRFCAVSLLSTIAITNHTFNTLIINAYLSTDYGTPDSNNAFIEAVAELDVFLIFQSYDR